MLNQSALPGETSHPRRNPKSGLVMLFAFAAAQAMFVGFLMARAEAWFELGWFEIVVPTVLVVPTLMMIGFSLTIPLLLFRSVAKRSLIGLLAAICISSLMILGFYLSDVYGFDADTCLDMTSVLLLGFVGALLPIGFVMSMFQWRIRAPGFHAPPAPIGITDLLALTACGAAVLGFQRSWGPFSDEQIPLNVLGLITAFYSLIGAGIAMSLLLPLRMMLGADRRPFLWPNVVGVALTVGVVAATWALPIFSENWSANTGRSPVLMWLGISAHHLVDSGGNRCSSLLVVAAISVRADQCCAGTR